MLALTSNDALAQASASIFSFKNISTVDVNNAIKNVKISSSSGHNGIYVLMLKISSPTLASKLANLFNELLSQSAFPEAWKCFIVSPVHKRKIYELKNYRPVSLLPTISKILEKSTWKTTTCSYLVSMDSGVTDRAIRPSRHFQTFCLLPSVINNGAARSQLILARPSTVLVSCYNHCKMWLKSVSIKLVRKLFMRQISTSQILQHLVRFATSHCRGA